MKRYVFPLLLATLMVCGMTSRGQCEAETGPAELLKQARSQLSAVEDPVERVDILSDVAHLEAMVGDRKAAAATLAEALRIAAAQEDTQEDAQEDRESMLIVIAMEQSDLGDAAGALRTVLGIDDDHIRWNALVDAALAAAGDAKMARKIAAAIGDPSWKDSCLKEVAVAQAQAGKADEALETADQIEEPSTRSMACLLVALSVGNIDEALRIACSFENRSRKAEAFLEIADAQRKSGDEAAAARTYQRVVEAAKGLADARPFSGLVLAQARLGNYPQALRAARSIDEREYRPAILYDVAVIQAERGDFKEALETARGIWHAGTRTAALGEIATARARKGDITAALELAETIEDWWYKGRALQEIASVQFERGDRDGCRNTLRQALTDDVKPCPLGTGDEVRALAEIGAALLKAGDPATATRAFQQARKATAHYEDESYRAILLQQVARCQAEGGQAAEALAWGKESPALLVRIRVILGVVEGMLNRTESRNQ